jgi:hypothetical protein
MYSKGAGRSACAFLLFVERARRWAAALVLHPKALPRFRRSWACRDRHGNGYASGLAKGGAVWASCNENRPSGALEGDNPRKTPCQMRLNVDLGERCIDICNKITKSVAQRVEPSIQKMAAEGLSCGLSPSSAPRIEISLHGRASALLFWACARANGPASA